MAWIAHNGEFRVHNIKEENSTSDITQANTADYVTFAAYQKSIDTTSQFTWLPNLIWVGSNPQRSGLQIAVSVVYNWAMRACFPGQHGFPLALIWTCPGANQKDPSQIQLKCLNMVLTIYWFHEQHLSHKMESVLIT